MTDATCRLILAVIGFAIVIGLIYRVRRRNEKSRSGTGDSGSTSPSTGSPAPPDAVSSARRRPEQVSIGMHQAPEPIQMLDQQHGFFPMRFAWRGREYQAQRIGRFWTLSDASGRIMRHCFLVYSGEGSFEMYYDVERQVWLTTLYSTRFTRRGRLTASDIPVDYLPGPLRCSADSMRACRDELNLPVDFISIVWCEKIEQDIIAVTVPGGRVPEAWEAFRDAVPSTGRWPVLIGSCATLYGARHWLRRPDRETPEQILAKADALADESWREELHWDISVEGDLPSLDDLREGREEPGPFSWVRTTLKNDSIILLPPTRYGWQSAAYLNFGGNKGWNECPPAHEHVAYHRYWHDRFGANVAFMAGDCVEMVVANPPLTREALVELLCEQFRYCIDLGQTTDWFGEHACSLENVARDLLGVHRWRFWWD